MSAEHRVDMEQMAKHAQAVRENVLSSIGKVVVGKEDIAEKMLICLLSSGHVLIEDVPGIGKTTIVNALARSMRLDFQRIQFTPDLMPSDVTGFNLYNPKIADFEFREGAVMTQVLLADEINRSSPRTQSSLLEAMQEGQVSVEGKTYTLPRPFIVLATQNPIENVGTYPLPEAQMDRFMMRLSIGYPSLEEEMHIVALDSRKQMHTGVRPVATEEDILALQEAVRQVTVSDALKQYVVQLCRATRLHPAVHLGVSPRAAQMLLNASCAYALLHGRDYLRPDDVQYLLHDVLDHRIILKPTVSVQGVTREQVVEEILTKTVAPR